MDPALGSEQLARKARIAIIEALFHSGGGHYGGSLSVTDILAVLYSERHRRSVDDRIILSKGHAAIALYAVLCELGLLAADLKRYGAFGSGLAGHPDMTTLDVGFSTGSLGQGLAAGLGMALELRRRPSPAHVWVVLGDGECQEGQIWEAAMLGSRYRVHTLHAIIDANGAQECGWGYDKSLDQAPLPSAIGKWMAFGWHASAVDGHNHSQLKHWMSTARQSSHPTIAVARTQKGRGVLVTEPTRLHCGQLTSGEYHAALRELRS